MIKIYLDIISCEVCVKLLCEVCVVHFKWIKGESGRIESKFFKVCE